jgi:hypothetical protein
MQPNNGFCIGLVRGNYYRYDSEASVKQSSRIIKSVLFRTGGAPAPANAGFGYLIGNLSLTSMY